MRSDAMLGYEFAQDSSPSQMTGHAGLLPYLDLACVLGLLGEADARIGVCGKQGWMDRQHVLSLVLLNLAGGECVEDIRILEADAGLIVRLGPGNPALEWLSEMRRLIRGLVPSPA